MIAYVKQNFVRLAALGALGVAPGALGLWALLALVFRPTPTSGMPGSGGGIDAVSWAVVVIALIVPLGLAAAWHVNFGRQLQAGKNTCPGA